MFLSNAENILARDCINFRKLGDGFEMCPGAWLNSADFDIRQPIDSEFGIRLMCEGRKKILIRLGFDINIDQGLFNIVHSPQSLSSHELCCENSARIYRNENFRDAVLDKAINIAWEIGARQITGISARNHPKVKSGMFGIESALNSMDRLYKRFNFMEAKNGNYFLNLDVK